MASKVLVVGSGVMGLRTAIELLSHRIRVVLRSPRPPLHLDTCSQGAGGYWMPFHIHDDRVDRWCTETLDELLLSLSLSLLEEEDGDGDNDNNDNGQGRAMVELVPALMFYRQAKVKVKVKTKSNANDNENVDDDDDDDNDDDTQGALPEWTKDERLHFQHLSMEELMLENQNRRRHLRIPPKEELVEAGYTSAWLYDAPVVDAPRMLKAMCDRVTAHALADVNVNTGVEYASMEEVLEEAVKHGCDAVVNCTGLGAKRLCDDDEIVGGRGVVLHYDRSCERRGDGDGDGSHNDFQDVVMGTDDPPWGSDTAPCYLIPRGDVLVVGGTFLEGDTESGIRDDERSQLERNAHRMGIDTSLSRPTGQWTGFRPVRTQVRLELDDVYGTTQGIPVVHNYGHGGSGWTVFVGAAKEVVRLLHPKV